MINFVFKSSQEIESLICHHFKEITVNEKVDKDSIFILEVNDVSDLDVELERDYDLVVVIDNGNLIFDILELRPSVILRESKLEKDLVLLEELLLDKKKHVQRIIEFKSGHLTVRLKIETIMYIESFGHYLEIHTSNGRFMVRDKLMSVLNRLEGFDFRQIHKSFIVNEKYIRSISSKNCILENNIELPVGRAFK